MEKSFNNEMTKTFFTQSKLPIKLEQVAKDETKKKRAVSASSKDLGAVISKMELLKSELIHNMESDSNRESTRSGLLSKRKTGGLPSFIQFNQNKSCSQFKTITNDWYFAASEEDRS
jgi:hypothetical protein